MRRKLAYGCSSAVGLVHIARPQILRGSAEGAALMNGVHKTEMFIVNGFEVGKMLAGQLCAVEKSQSSGIGCCCVSIGRQGTVGIAHGRRASADGNVQEACSLRSRPGMHGIRI